MARQYRPKYYPQLKQGTGFTWIHPTTGEQQECKGVEWYLDFLDTRGKRCRRKVHEGYCTCPTRKKGVCPHERLAMEALAEVLSAPSPPEVVLKQASRDLSLDKFAAEYLLGINDSRRHAVRSKQIIGLSIETFLAFCRKNSIVDLDQIQRLHIERFRDGLASREGCGRKKLKNRTINRYIGDIRAMLNRAIERGLIEKNPAQSRGRNDTLFLPTDDEATRTVLTEAELAKLLALTDEDLKPLFARNYRVIREMLIIFYRTGMRLGELVNLTHNQIRNGVIHIEPHNGWKPKWGIRRQIPMHQTVAEIVEIRRREFPGSVYLFETASGTSFNACNVQQDFDRLFKKFGIVGDTGNGVSTHCLRHSFATTCLLSGVPLTTVKDWLGHQNIEMTMVYYHMVRSVTDKHMAGVNFVN